MQEQASDLEVLIDKYQNTINTLNKQLNEAKSKLDIAKAALYLLKEEGQADQKQLFVRTTPIPIPTSNKYSDWKMKDAIIDVLKNNSEQKLTGLEIYKALIKNGFHSNSANLRRDVYITLNRLRKDDKNKIDRVEEEKRKKYFYVEN